MIAETANLATAPNVVKQPFEIATLSGPIVIKETREMEIKVGE